jgi:hypothetical protein
VEAVIQPLDEEQLVVVEKVQDRVFECLQIRFTERVDGDRECGKITRRYSSNFVITSSPASPVHVDIEHSNTINLLVRLVHFVEDVISVGALGVDLVYEHCGVEVGWRF